MIKQYRKKPVVIEAVQYDGTNIGEIWEWARVAKVHAPTENNSSCFIETLEGKMECRLHDYIIKGVQGELYPVKLDIFNETYEEVDPKLNASLGQL